MMNWIYTWHHPKTDADAESLARQMGDIFLHGLICATNGRKRANKNLGLKPAN